MSFFATDPPESFFEVLRLAEVEATLELFKEYAPEGARVLEVGAGRGWQARALARAGYSVEAIDLPATVEISNHARGRIFPITDYDGASVPFEPSAFDVVYSSNVLEHVVEFDRLNEELHRVLKPNGFAIHLVPTSLWRVSSILAYYPAQVVDLLRLLRRRVMADVSSGSEAGGAGRGVGVAISAKILRRLVPSAHGAIGNPATELFRYSRASWTDTFQSRGWKVVRYGQSDIWATGEYLMGHRLSLEARRRIARLVGGIAHIFVLRSERDLHSGSRDN